MGMMDRAGSVRKQTKDALARIADLEENQMKLAEGTNQGLQQANYQISFLQERVEAIVSLLESLSGAGSVEKTVTETRAKNLAARVEAEKNLVKAAMAKGDIAVAEVIGPKSLVVGAETDKDGTVTNERIQILYSNFKPEFREKVVGQKVGFFFELPGNAKFTVTEIYDEVVKPVAPETPVAAVAPGAETVSTVATPAVPVAEATPEGCDGNCGDCPLAKKADCEAPEKKA